MKGNHIYEIIGKYLADEVSEKEKLKVRKWLSESDSNVQEFELHKKAWEETHIRFEAQDSESVFKNILNKIDDQQELDNTVRQRSASRKVKQRFIFIAKVAASLLLFATIWYYFNTVVPKPESPELAIETIQKLNLAGQKSRIFLPDGSVVWLNADSKIIYPEKFSNEKREVTLEGEAFFEIIKNPNQPFIVKAGKVSTTVLGTSFNVKAFKDEPAIYVALKNGKVKVEMDDQRGKEAMFLEPGEAIKYTKSDAIAKKEAFDQELLLAWKDGIIVFKDAGFDEIINTLSRWYGVQFEIENRKNDAWSYTGSFDHAILENVLQSISFTKEFSYHINQKNVIIKFN